MFVALVLQMQGLAVFARDFHAIALRTYMANTCDLQPRRTAILFK
jgi:hypothetical protein